MGKKKGKGKKKKGNNEDGEKTAKRMELSLELQMGETNARLLRESWRERMKNMNLPVIKENLEAAWKAFDRAVDNKNYTISILLDGLDSSNEQRRRSENLHMDALDKSIRAYSRLVENGESKYQSVIDQALDDARDLNETMETDQTNKEMHLRTTTFATKQAYERSIEIIQTKNSSKLDTRVEEYDNELKVARIFLKRRVRSLLEENAKLLQDHEESTKDLRKEYNAVKLRHDEDQKTIALQSRRIEKLFNIIQDIKHKTSEFRKISEKDISDYRFERDYFYNAYLGMQKRQLAEQNFDKEQLRINTMEYNITGEYLDERLEKVEKILNMVSLCEKYETFEDKIIVFPVSMSNGETLCQEMQKFFKVIDSVQQDTHRLKDLLIESEEERHFLKRKLKLYMNKVLNNNTKNETCQQTKTGKPNILKLRDVIHY